MIAHDPFVQLVAGRQLGGLDDTESSELDRHLVGCAGCAAEVRAISNTLADLALVVPARHPPGSLVASTMAAARAMEPVSVPVVRAWARPLAAGLAAALVMVSLSAWSSVANLRSELDKQRSSVAAAESELALQAAATAVALDPRHVSATLVPDAIAPAAEAQVVYRPGTDEAYLVAHHVPATPPGKVYQLWYADAVGVHPLATVSFDGSGALIVPFGVDLGGKSAAMVTLETVGGAQGTPGPQLVFGTLPKL